jgi:hypothetical protein
MYAVVWQDLFLIRRHGLAVHRADSLDAILAGSDAVLAHDALQR